VPGAEFFVSTAGITNFDANAPITVSPRAGAYFLRDSLTDSATATFVVPMDYASGQAIPKITVYTGASASGKFGFDIAFGRFGDIANVANNNWNTRFSFYSGAGNAAGDSKEESTAIAAGNANSPPAWSAGDIIVISITRRSNNADDVNAGMMFIFGVSFDYDADM